MDILFLIGRILFGGYFVKSAWNHFMKAKGLAGYAASRGVPLPTLAVIATGFLLLIGGLGILCGVWIRWAVFSLVLFLVPATFYMHPYWRDSDPNMKMMNSVNFWKNLALLGAVLVLLAIPEPWPFSLL